MKWITMKCMVNNKVTQIPKNTQPGTVCPCRDDYFQTMCWNCDLCGRNEAYEHGASFDTIKIGDFSFYVEDISNPRVINHEYIFEYGDKKIIVDIHLIDDEFCGYSLQEIWEFIVTLKEKGTVEDSYYDVESGHADTIYQYADSTHIMVESGLLVFDKLSDEHAVLMMVTSQLPEEVPAKTFVDLINYCDQEQMSEEEWEDIYGYDI